MPSKGVELYSYIAVPGCEIEFQVPKTTIIKRDLHQLQKDHLEIDKKNLGGAFNFKGRFSFKVSRDGSEITTQWVDVNVLTGNLENGTMKEMEQTPSVITNDLVVTYSFYDAGSGVAGLPRWEQCFVTVTWNHSNWMAAIAPSGSPQADRPFRRLILPAAHDVGMNSMQNCEALIQGAPGIAVKTFLKSGMLDGVVNGLAGGIVNDIASNIIRALAITQKDTLASILAIGARYFEFRPAHIHDAILPHSPIPDKVYFQHGPIVGMLYEQFLHDIVHFLVEHPSEIVVVQLRYDGVPNECRRPSDDEYREVLENALQAGSGSIHVGSYDDMNNLTINDLRNQGKRLILFNGVDQYSTYDDAANATLNGDTIVQAFDRLNDDEHNRHNITVIQCQATATNIPDVIKYSAISSNASTSPLLATKPICDAKTLPWIKDRLIDRLRGEKLTIVMNDFFDGATADICVGLSIQRLQ